MKLPFILFFIKGPFPSKQDLASKAEIESDKAKVCFRNSLHVPAESHALEVCDGVAGAVPEIYAKRFPKAEVAIKVYKESLKILSQKVGDVSAPKNNPKPKQGDFVPPVKNSPPAWNPNPNPPA